jgi:hypothetical protein
VVVLMALMQPIKLSSPTNQVDYEFGAEILDKNGDKILTEYGISTIIKG